MEAGSIQCPIKKIGPHTCSIAPRSSSNMLQIETAFGQKILHPCFRPTRTVNRLVMYPYKKGGSDKEVASGIQHLADVLAGAIWPQKMFEDLFGDDQIKRLCERRVANIKVRIVNALIASKR